MNKLFLIGNGFDLAHGLKTSYSDFLVAYINQVFKKMQDNGVDKYKDKLISIVLHVAPNFKINSVNDILRLRDQGYVEITFNDLFEHILKNHANSNWVDIEHEYYYKLLELYKQIESQIEKHNYFNIETFIKDVNALNHSLSLIKEKLIEYLGTLSTNVHNDIVRSRIKDEIRGTEYAEIMYLVFNYTDTIKLYDKNNFRICHIHGQLGNDKNPIIFGYGDEMDEYYTKLENLNRNEILDNFKSFGYFKADSYWKLKDFLTKGDYKVNIMGHSCGLSDRVLLNSIFCNPNCKQIQIYYHQKENGENDFDEKTKEISRHFPLDQKNRMRELIVPFPRSCSLG